MKTILKNKWHLHALILVFVISVLWYSDNHPNWFDFENVGNFWRAFIVVFVSFCIACFAEWLQGNFFGAHQGKQGFNDSRNDVIATTVVAVIGCILFPIINPFAFLIGSVLVIAGLEIYKRKTK